MKLGQLLLILLASLGKISYYPFTLRFSLPKFNFKFNFKLKFKKSKRGRPKTRPQTPLIFNQLKRKVKKTVPSPIRIAFIISVFFIFIFLYSFFLITISQQLPTPDKLNETNQPMTTEFYDRNGNLLYRLYDGKNRTLVKLEDLPNFMVQATLAIEDKNFYRHPGVDLSAIARAALAYFNRQQLQGGSTITQQLIKNTLLTPERTWQRKAREIFLAFWAERVFTKQEILQMYFNEVPYGGTSWGIQAASQTYFGKDVKDLNLAEASFLAGLPASPTTFSPYGNNPQLAKMRQKEVLRRMVEEGFITKAQADQAAEQPLEIKPPMAFIKAPHFVMYVKEILAQKYGEKVVSQGGLKVATTLDLDLEQQTEQIVQEEVEKLANLRVGNGAVMVTDARNGQILAMVGSKNYWDPKIGSFNVATALRQPGSSIKPITYATGFKLGYSPGTILLDTPVVFKNEWEVYAPGNYDGRFHGPVTIRTALGSSYNIPAVKMLSLVGIPEMLKTAKDLGITSLNQPNRYGLSLTLGGGEVKLIDMMTAYGTFSQMGQRHQSQAILKVTDSTGKVLEDNSYQPGTRVLPAGVAFLITDILKDNKARTPAFGPNSLLNIPGKTVAVKTGTTDSKRDNWTFGYTPEFVVGVWVGNNDNSVMDPQLTSGVTGAAPIWNKIMTNILQDRPNLAFEKPTEVTEGIADGNRDLVIKGLTPKTAVGFGRQKVKTEKNPEGEEKITFTDPFTTFVPAAPAQPPQNP